MPVYRYRAMTARGATDGFITADTPAAGRALLRKRGLAVVRFAEQRARGSDATTAGLPWFFWNSRGQGLLGQGFRGYFRGYFRGCFRGYFRGRGFRGWGGDQSLNEVVRHLVMLLRAGVSLGEALSVVARQAPRSLEPAIRRVTEKVNGGMDFAQALSEEKGIFDHDFIGLVRVGQASGQLESCLHRLVELRSRRQQLRQRVTAAMAYPAIVTTVGIGVIFFLMTYVVPRITSLILQSGRSIPLPTKVLLTATGVVNRYGWLILLGVGLGLVLIYCSGRTKQLLALLFMITAKMPLLGGLLMKSGIAQSGAMLETMLRSGLPLDEALDITRRSIFNPLLRNEYERMAASIRGGHALAEVHASQSVLPPVVMHMLAIGEQAGQLEDVLQELAETFDRDVEVAARQIVAILEPALIVAISLVVGFIVLATILPIVRISETF